jgi:hypothetical protein
MWSATTRRCRVRGRDGRGDPEEASLQGRKILGWLAAARLSTSSALQRSLLLNLLPRARLAPSPPSSPTTPGHSCEHELETARINGVLGNVDANTGDAQVRGVAAVFGPVPD